MHVELSLPNEIAGRVFFTWTPVNIGIRLRDGTGDDREVEIRNPAGSVPLAFDAVRSDGGGATLRLTLPGDESEVSFWVAGRFQFDAAGEPVRNQGSVRYGDAGIEVFDVASGDLLNSQSAMVRVRKNANFLTPEERDRFLLAFGTLNGSGSGRFTNFRDMHSTPATDRESHGNRGFLPWHRAYLLDLERELQAIDNEVTLPYWRFDQPAPNLFTREYMGFDGPGAFVEFVAGHPFSTWTTDGVTGIDRELDFSPSVRPPGLLTQSQTLALGGTSGSSSFASFTNLFSGMERNPHGSAHVSFTGDIDNPLTAPKDPMFFLLHCNADRLWAKWQSVEDKMSAATASSFAPPFPFGNPTGHRLDDTMWPWNGVTGAPRPPDAPGGALARSPLTNAPGDQPRVRDMIDYQGDAGAEQQFFCYDDVPFEVQSVGS